MPILLPPLEAQKLYSDKSVPFYHRIEIVRRENQELQKMYHLLIDILILTEIENININIKEILYTVDFFLLN